MTSPGAFWFSPRRSTATGITGASWPSWPWHPCSPLAVWSGLLNHKVPGTWLLRAAGSAAGGLWQISSTPGLSGPELKDGYLSSPCFTVHTPFFLLLLTLISLISFYCSTQSTGQMLLINFSSVEIKLSVNVAFDFCFIRGEFSQSWATKPAVDTTILAQA